MMTGPEITPQAQRQAEASVAGPATEVLERLAEKLASKASVSAAFGEPVARAGMTIIPVARVGHLENGTSSAAIAAAAGTVLLLGRWLAVRYTGLAPARRGFAFTAAVLLVLAAVVLGTAGWPPALHVLFLQWRLSAIFVATALAECVAVAVSLADSRSRQDQP